jgi:predicted transcriptional regulator
MGLQIGTGGVASPQYLKQRGDAGYAYPIFRGEPEAILQAAIRTTSDNLRLVRETFQVPVASLASLFGVSRQAIYDWQAGKSISKENEAKLDEIAHAVRVLQLAGVSPTQVHRRKIAGKTLLETIRDGGNAAQSASKLVMLLQKEAAQRSEIESLLRGRRSKVDQGDLGIPHFEE